MNYEIIEHTADIGIKAYGKNIEDCFRSAAVALFSIMLERSTKPSPTPIRRKIKITAEDLESLLFDWLSHLLYVHQADMIVFSDFDVKIRKQDEGYKLHATAYGEKYDENKHRIVMEVKAVTYHMLEVNVEQNYVQVIFDI